jgi:hypothetical protein
MCDNVPLLPDSELFYVLSPTLAEAALQRVITARCLARDLCWGASPRRSMRLKQRRGARQRLRLCRSRRGTTHRCGPTLSLRPCTSDKAPNRGAPFPCRSSRGLPKAGRNSNRTRGQEGSEEMAAAWDLLVGTQKSSGAIEPALFSKQACAIAMLAASPRSARWPGTRPRTGRLASLRVPAPPDPWLPHESRPVSSQPAPEPLPSGR